MKRQRGPDTQRPPTDAHRLVEPDPSAQIPARASVLQRLQRAAGNSAVVSLLQRETTTREDMVAAFDSEVRGAKWQDVALRLNGFAAADIPVMIAKMKLEEILHTRHAVTEFLAQWPRQAEILAALDAASRSRRQPRGSLPPSSTVWAAYQPVSYGVLTKDQVWEFIGGSIGKSLTGQDTCAARISWAFNHAGLPIGGVVDFVNSPKVAFNGKRGDGMSYDVKTSTLAGFLTSSFGQPDEVMATSTDAEALEKTLGPGKIALVVSDRHAGVIKVGYKDPYATSAGLWAGPFKVWKLP